MTLEEWQELVSLYGDLAYLMCFFEITPLCGVTAGCNDGIIQWFANTDYTQLKKKQSAALPFDLVAVRAGDKVEWFDGKQWSDFKIRKYGLVQQNMLTFYKYHSMDFRSIDIGYLRMKHPRRLGVDYSQFEEK